MIKNEADSLKRLEAELSTLPPRLSVYPSAFEDIGNGLCRLHLDAAKTLALETVTVNRLFVGTSRAVSGSTESFAQKLRVLRQCCQSGALPFDAKAVDPYIHAAVQGCPLISHSDTYRATYHPAYRVVKSACGVYMDVFKRIDALSKLFPSVTVAIDGNSAAGKSTLAALLQEMYDCNVFHMDDFFLPPQRRTAERLSSPGGNVDHERFTQEVMAGLHSGKAFCYRRYDCHKNTLSVPVTALPKPLNIVEGVYSLHPRLASAYNLKIFLQTDKITQLKRIALRNGEKMLRHFADEWIPLENRYFEKLDIASQCDIVFDQNNN